MTVAPPPQAPTCVRTLLESLEAHGIADHGARVATLASEVGRRLGLSQRPTALLTTAALLHDIGRLGPPGQTGRVALRSEDVLRTVPGLEAAALIVRHVHERWDGRGGPDGLKRQKIPLGSRIIGACDAWDVLSSSLSHRDAVGALRAGAGAQWDPKIVAAVVAKVDGGTWS